MQKRFWTFPMALLHKSIFWLIYAITIFTPSSYLSQF